MNTIEQRLIDWKQSLVSSLALSEVYARNPTAYRWKAPFRVWVIREAVFWRLQDLMVQSHQLHQQGHGLGARILLRSAIETLATLIYLNQTIQQVLDGQLAFNEFSKKTSILLLGTRNEKQGPPAINIITVLGKCDKRYPGLMAIYGQLSESAHPNFEGLCLGYSKIAVSEHETHFSNRWTTLHGNQHPELMELCMDTFEGEYDDVWPPLIGRLESWIAANNAELEKSKDAPTEGATGG